ncbi:putative cytochrome P450 [Rosa chinensis]|uniref:Putative cytochrome P450 n=1 Tax=Rosa chinensis TaxID=74649 RepID=A0A2P6R2C5_ROSCH|nr:putative cytochrome P450 [Rosa chinensis]
MPVRISVDELVVECKTFYFAGQETTNTLPAWPTLLLALHPEWLYPPAILLARKVSREVRLGKLLVPANVELLVPTLALHHEP